MKFFGALNRMLAQGWVLALLLSSVPAYAVAPTEEYPVVKLQTLDKITARMNTFEARVGSTVKFGPLYIKVQACRKTPVIELPEAAAFLQVWEIVRDTETIAANALAESAEQGKPQWVFSGWMFASSPALSPMDHPVYDVWVIDCLQDQAAIKAQDELKEAEIEAKPDVTPEQAAEEKAEEQGEAKPAAATPAPQEEQELEAQPAPVPQEQQSIPEEEAPPAPVTSPYIQVEELE